jgi:hypothetical protein
MQDFLPVIAEMHKGLLLKCNSITPTSGKAAYEDYFKSLLHYRKIFQTYVARHSEELHVAIEKAHKNTLMFDKVDG